MCYFIAIVQEIYEAQRLRDEAVASRMKRSDQERDDALRRLELLQQQTTK